MVAAAASFNDELVSGGYFQGPRLVAGIVAWALVGFVDGRARDRTGSFVSPYHLIAGLDALLAAIALAAGRKAEALHGWSGARDLATVAAIEVTAPPGADGFAPDNGTRSAGDRFGWYT